MKKCPVCGALISDQMVSCPICASKSAPQPPTAASEQKAAPEYPVWVRIAMWPLAFIMAFFMLFFGCGAMHGSMAFVALRERNETQLKFLILFLVAGMLAWGAYIGMRKAYSIAAASPLADSITINKKTSWAYRALIMIFFAVIWAIAYSKFLDLMPPKTHDGETKGSLSSVRSALQVYYSDNQGRFPTDLQALVVNAKYLMQIPSARITEHPSSNAVQYISGEDFKAGRFTDTGGWAYVNSSTDPRLLGEFVVNCTHAPASRNLPKQSWTTY